MKKKYHYKPKYALMTEREVRDDVKRDWMSYSVKFAAIQERAERVQLPDGRYKTLIRCCGCEGLFVRSEIQAHHINPIGKLNSTSVEDVEDYIARTFVKKNQIQPLCKSCHDNVEHKV